MLYLGKDPQPSWDYPPLTEQGYANRELFDFWRDRDPIARYASRLEAAGIVAPGDVDRFIEIVQQSPGTVFLHCGAGVGRTGSMAAAYLVRSGQADADDVFGASLAVGPPSLEQLYFIGSLDGGDKTPPLVVGISRVLDGPRRIWSDLRS